MPDQLAAARAVHTATLLDDGRLLVVGGCVVDGCSTATDSVMLLITDGSRSAAGMSDPRDAHTATLLADGSVPVVGGFAAASVPDGSVLVTGGRGTGDESVAFAVVIAVDGTATSVADLAQARFKHEMVTLPTGEVLVIGGTSNDRELLRSTEIYDPVGRTFRPGPELSQGRYKMTGGVAVLPDGRVLVGTGATGAEVLDMSNGSTVPVAGAPAARSMSATADVVGGELIVLGGYGDGIVLNHTQWRVPLSELPAA